MVRLKKFMPILMSLLLILSLVASMTVSVSAASKPAKVTISKVTVSKNVATITWKKAKNAKKYEVNISGKTYNVKTTSYKFTGKSNTSYTVKVRGVNGKTKGSWSTTRTFKTGTSDADTIKALKAENSKLASENNNLKVENKKLQSTNSTLKSENKNLKEDNSDLQSIIDTLKDKIAELEAKIKELEAKVEELGNKIEELLSGSTEDPEEQVDAIKGVWYYDKYSDKDPNYVIYTQSYIFDGKGNVRDDDGNVGTYTLNVNDVSITINNKTVNFTLDPGNMQLVNNERTLVKSAPIPKDLVATWNSQGENVWSKMFLEADGTFHFQYSDVPDSPYYIAHMVDEDSIMILSEIYDYKNGLLVQRRLPHVYYAKYMNVVSQWKCLELNPDYSSYDGVLWITEKDRNNTWSVTDNKYLNFEGEVYTLNNDAEKYADEYMTVERNGKIYKYERWHDPNVM